MTRKRRFRERPGDNNVDLRSFAATLSKSKGMLFLRQSFSERFFARITLSIIIVSIYIALISAAFFYLFVLPMYVALHAIDSNALAITFSAFLLVQVFMLTIEYAYEAAATFYNFKRKVLFLILRHPYPATLDVFRGNFAISRMFISHFLFVYAFSVLYVYISAIDPSSFSTGRPLSVSDGIYFSAVTAATVGYGDIATTTSVARVVTIIQIYVSLFYAVSIFAGATSYLALRRNDDLSRQRDALSRQSTTVFRKLWLKRRIKHLRRDLLLESKHFSSVSPARRAGEAAPACKR